MSRAITLDTSNMRELIQHFLLRVMTLDKDKILSSRVRKAVETLFSTVFPSTAYEGHLDRRKNFFRRFLLLVLRVLTLEKRHFFCSAWQRGGWMRLGFGDSGRYGRGVCRSQWSGIWAILILAKFDVMSHRTWVCLVGRIKNVGRKKIFVFSHHLCFVRRIYIYIVAIFLGTLLSVDRNLTLIEF